MIGNIIAGLNPTPPLLPVVTGGTLYTSGGYNYRVFTSNGTLGISNNSLSCDVLLIAGGGGGGSNSGGGGNQSTGGSANTGGGGGGWDGSADNNSGGSGLIIVRYAV